MSPYYDRTGQPITMIEWSAQFDDDRRVAHTKVAGVEVSTLWIGIDHGDGMGPPQIFETMIFGGEYDGHQVRYATEEQAVDGHKHIVSRLRDGLTP